MRFFPRDTPQDLGPAVPTATFGWQKKRHAGPNPLPADNALHV